MKKMPASKKLSGYSIRVTVALFIILLLCNLIVGELPSRYTKLETSSSEYFDFSDITYSVLSSLDDDINIYWITQKGKEDPLVRTLLERYHDINNRITITSVDPDIYPQFTQAYTSETVANNSVIVESGTRSKYLACDGDIYEYDYTNYMATNQYEVYFAGENALTTAINYVTTEIIPSVCILQDHGEEDLPDTFLAGITHINLSINKLSLLKTPVVPDNACQVIINGPKVDLAYDEVEALRLYLERGGSLFVISGSSQDDTVLTNLDALLAEYGVARVKGLVLEANSNHYILDRPYYIVPSLGYHSILTPLIENRYNVLLPLSQGITAIESNADCKISSLLSTSNDSYSKPSGYKMSTYAREDYDIPGPFDIAVAVENTRNSSRIVWVSSETLTDSSTNERVSGGNLEFFLNSCSWLENNTDSISIHSKSMAKDYLLISNSSANIIRIAIAVIPAAYLAAGIIIYLRRRAK